MRFVRGIMNSTYPGMASQLPNRIVNYKVSATSPLGELLTLGQIYAEVGDYNASFCDGVHLSVARKCVYWLNKITDELTTRGVISTEDDLYVMPSTKFANADLSKMTVDELHKLYRQWPIRHKARKESGREHNTFFFEGHIVRELQKRKPASKEEQLKIDYCTLTYQNELENLSIVLDLPLSLDDSYVYPDSTRYYTLDELTFLIKQYQNPKDVIEREILLEYIDYAHRDKNAQ